MRVDIKTDPNNVDKIGSPNNPGLKQGQLTRAQHRERLIAKYKGREVDLEELLDTLYEKPSPLLSNS
jgi:hypothetical protein